jgi:hypothetical protein
LYVEDDQKRYAEHPEIECEGCRVGGDTVVRSEELAREQDVTAAVADERLPDTSPVRRATRAEPASILPAAAAAISTKSWALVSALQTGDYTDDAYLKVES